MMNFTFLEAYPLPRLPPPPPHTPPPPPSPAESVPSFRPNGSNPPPARIQRLLECSETFVSQNLAELVRLWLFHSREDGHASGAKGMPNHRQEQAVGRAKNIREKEVDRSQQRRQSCSITLEKLDPGRHPIALGVPDRHLIGFRVGLDPNGGGSTQFDRGHGGNATSAAEVEYVITGSKEAAQQREGRTSGAVLSAAEGGFGIEDDGERIWFVGLREPGGDNRKAADLTGTQPFAPAGGPITDLHGM